MSLQRRRGLAVASILGVLLAGFSSACSSSPTQASSASPKTTPTVVASPTPDAATQKYVALIKSYWIQIQAADEATSATNVAAKVCLGEVSMAAPQNVQFVDPSKCRARMIAGLPVQEKFLSALKTTPAPPQFSADDQVFRSQLPKGIAALKALIAITTTGSTTAIQVAANIYVSDFIPTVTSALDDVDPSVTHI
jgi:hypothetical protein